MGGPRDANTGAGSAVALKSWNGEFTARQETVMRDSRRILLVDDSATVCRMVDLLLRKCGFEHIDAVNDGPTALERLRTTPYDIIFCDWEMEPMNGLSVLRHVRNSPAIAAVPFILMSAKKEPHWVLQAAQAGANCLISKPFDADTLRAKIGQLAPAHARA
jgi:two-component system chemotaxis response regulator CheY